MDYIIPLLLLACGWAHSEPLKNLIQKRSSYGSYAQDYSQNYEPYMFAAIPLHPPMPVLHVLSPSPLAPPKRDLHHSGSKHHQTYSKPGYHSHHSSASYTSHSKPSSSYGKTHSSSDFTRSPITAEDYSKPYFSSYTGPSYAEYPRTYSQKEHGRPNEYPYESSEESYSQLLSASVPHSFVKSHHNTYALSQGSSPPILYAQPTAHGGYSYHKEPTKKRKSAPKKKVTTESPVIVRVHRHRITRD